jgi:histidinol-phosphate/aromatic aminotransferase/cobyric acid decarboxylase-like protein
MLTKDFGLDVEGLLASITDETKVIFICSPNKPTGKQFPKMTF